MEACISLSLYHPAHPQISANLQMVEISMEQAIQLMLNGYVVSDLNGDGISEASDFSLIENNAGVPIVVMKP